MFLTLTCRRKPLTCAQREQISGELNQLKSRIENLVTSGFVTDSASGAFQQMYTNFTMNATNLIGTLDQIAGTLDSMAKTLETTDKELGSKIGG